MVRRSDQFEGIAGPPPTFQAGIFEKSGLGQVEATTKDFKESVLRASPPKNLFKVVTILSLLSAQTRIYTRHNTRDAPQAAAHTRAPPAPNARGGGGWMTCAAAAAPVACSPTTVQSKPLGANFYRTLNP